MIDFTTGKEDKQLTENDFESSEVKLIGEQQEAVDDIIKFISDSERQFYVLKGYAGTGKTTIISYLAQNLRKQGVRVYGSFIPYMVVSAPTNKAVKVLQTKLDNANVRTPSATIHKLLAIRPFINEKTGDEEYKPDKWADKSIMDYNVIVIDEASMVNRHLIKIIREELQDLKIKVLYVGDPAQLPPVNETHSPSFDTTSSFELTNVIRYGNTINKFATFIRKNQDHNIVIPKIHEVGENGQGVVTYATSQFRKKIEEIFTDPMYEKNPEFARVLAYTNDRVKYWNNYIRTLLMGENIPQFITGDRLVAREACVEGKDNIILKNSEEVYVTNVTIKNKGKLKYWLLNCKNVDTLEHVELRVIHKDSEKDHRISLQKHAHKKDWRKFYSEKKWFHDVTYSHALTVHKCLVGDTFIYSSEGLKQLKDFDNGANVGEFKNLDNNISVFNGQYMEKPDAFYNNGKSEINVIKTERGYELKPTNDHFIDVLDESGIIVKKKSEEIKVGDGLILNKSQNIFGSETKLPEKWQIRGEQDVRTVQYKRPSKMTKEFARFLGCICADGTVQANRIHFGKRYEENVIDFCNITKELFGYDCTYRFNSDNMYIAEISSVDIAEYCNKIDGIQVRDKFIPECILNAPKEFQAEFLKAFFEDGTVNLKKGKFDHIEISMKSEKIKNQLQMMLLNFGIISTYFFKNNKHGGLHILYIYSSGAIIFKNEVGYISHFKKQRLELVKNFHLCNKSIPHLHKLVKSIFLDNNVKYINHKRVCSSFHKGSKGMTIETLDVFIRSFKDDETINKDWRFKYLEELHNKVYNGEWYIDRVKSIEKSIQPTYCLRMPETHKFIQNGFHGYNSQGSSHENVFLDLPNIEWNKNVKERNQLIYVGVTRATHMVNIKLK